MAVKILMIAPDNPDSRDAKFLADVMSGKEERWIGSSTEIMIPLGAMSVCGWAERELEQKGIHTEFKVMKQLVGNEELLRQVEAFAPDIVAFSAMSHNYLNALELARKLKTWAAKQGKELPIILGGDHVSGVLRAGEMSAFEMKLAGAAKGVFWDDELAMQFAQEARGAIDACVLGEGELTFAELLERLIRKDGYEDVDGLAYFGKSGIVLTKPRRRMSNDELDTLIALRENDASRQFYTKTYLTNPPHPALLGHYDAVSASRGCLYACTFCSVNTVFRGKIIGRRSAESIANEMQLLADKYNVRHVFFTDEIFTVDRRWTEHVCDALIARGLGRRLSWHCQSRVSDFVGAIGNKEAEEHARMLLSKMEQAGCCMIAFGIESISEVDLKGINKVLRIEQARKAFELINETGIFSCALMMFGAPFGGQAGSAEDVIQAHEDVLWLVDRIRFAIYTLLPGTVDWLRFKDKISEEAILRNDGNTHLSYNWTLFDTDHETLKGQEGARKLMEEIYAAVYGSEKWQERVRRKCEMHPELAAAMSHWRKVTEKHIAGEHGTPLHMRIAKNGNGGNANG